jgi:hypothetical protein
LTNLNLWLHALGAMMWLVSDSEALAFIALVALMVALALIVS